MRVERWFAACFTTAFSTLAAAGTAGTCEVPYFLGSTASVTGNSCTQTHIPMFSHGTIRTDGPAVVYSIPALREDAYEFATLTSTDPSYQPMLLICQSPCGTEGECYDADADAGGGSATVQIPLEDGKSYFAVVTSQADTCGDYRLTVQGPLDTPLQSP